MEMISRILGDAEVQEGGKRASGANGLAGAVPVPAREYPEMGAQMNHPSTRADSAVTQNHWVYNAIWFAANALLLIAVCLVFCAMTWEYSTRRYLKGFSDAVVPALAAPEEKITAILAWMAHGPARLPLAPKGTTQDRDPTDTLNYESLLKVCGSATNGFINLAASSGLSARRLLLLDDNRGAKHVVAEVLLNGQWIVVDPSFRTILRGANGQLLTRILPTLSCFQSQLMISPLRSELQLHRNGPRSLDAHSVSGGGITSDTQSLFANWSHLLANKASH